MRPATVLSLLLILAASAWLRAAEPPATVAHPPAATPAPTAPPASAPPPAPPPAKASGPDHFEPSEKVRADFEISFPVDI